MPTAHLIDWHTDNTGLILGIRVHDGVLRDFTYSDRKGIMLGIEVSSEENGTIELIEVSEFSADLRIGSIVSGVYTWRLKDVPETIWRLRDGAWSILYGNHYKIKDAKQIVKNLIKENPDQFLLHIIFSSDAHFAAICKNIIIKKSI